MKENIPQSRKFSIFRERFHSHGTFPQSKNLSTVVEILYNQGIFPQNRKFSSIKEFFHRRGNFQKSKILQKSFCKVSAQSKKFLQTKIQKGFGKAKILDPFNTKSYAKIFLAL